MPWKMLYIFLYVICQPKLWTWSSDSPHQTQSKDIFHHSKKKDLKFWVKILNLGVNFVGSIRRADKCKIWQTYIWDGTNNQWKLFSQCCSSSPIFLPFISETKLNQTQFIASVCSLLRCKGNGWNIIINWSSIYQNKERFKLNNVSLQLKFSFNSFWGRNLVATKTQNDGAQNLNISWRSLE